MPAASLTLKKSDGYNHDWMMRILRGPVKNEIAISFSELEGADSESNSPNFRHLPRASRLPKPSSTALSPREREREPERECVRGRLRGWSGNGLLWESERERGGGAWWTRIKSVWVLLLQFGLYLRYIPPFLAGFNVKSMQQLNGDVV